jgi:hypothetical protein
VLKKKNIKKSYKEEVRPNKISFLVGATRDISVVMVGVTIDVSIVMSPLALA